MARHSREFEVQPTRCGLCDDDIEVGELACYCDDEVCHIDCAEDA